MLAPSAAGAALLLALTAASWGAQAQPADKAVELSTAVRAAPPAASRPVALGEPSHLSPLAAKSVHDAVRLSPPRPELKLGESDPTELPRGGVHLDPLEWNFTFGSRGPADERYRTWPSGAVGVQGKVRF